MNTKSIVISIITSVIVVILGFSLFGGKTTERVIERQIGAVVSLDNVDIGYVSIGGKKQYYYQQGMFATSSAVCSIKNPYNATSTLVSFTVQVTSRGLTGSQSFDVSTSTTAYASSTPSYIKGFTTGTGQFSAVWAGVATTTNGNIIGMPGNATSFNVGHSNNIIAPTEYITVLYATTTPGTFGTYDTGTCTGVIEKL